jgi:hypothetical protein
MRSFAAWATSQFRGADAEACRALGSDPDGGVCRRDSLLDAESKALPGRSVYGISGPDGVSHCSRSYAGASDTHSHRKRMRFDFFRHDRFDGLCSNSTSDRAHTYRLTSLFPFRLSKRHYILNTRSCEGPRFWSSVGSNVDTMELQGTIARGFSS